MKTIQYNYIKWPPTLGALTIQGKSIRILIIKPKQVSNKTIIISVALIAISIVVFAVLYERTETNKQEVQLEIELARQEFEKRQKEDQELLEQQRKKQATDDFDDCQLAAHTRYIEYWNSFCKSLGLPEECQLYSEYSDRAEEYRTSEEEKCMEIYKQQQQ